MEEDDVARGRVRMKVALETQKFAVIVDEVLSADECDDLITRADAVGWAPSPTVPKSIQSSAIYFFSLTVAPCVKG